MLLDGVPGNDAFGGRVYWGRIPMLGVSQIEVIRGGGSSVWGNYALGGAGRSTSRPIRNHSTFNGRVELLATSEASFFISGFYYYEERGNGPPLQFNHTEPAAGRSAAASAHSTTANCASRPTPAESA